jgi:hypothetical protein
MFAPQRLDDKEGDAAKLLGMMQTIVRRGRVKGFIPWMVTQRPAVLSKDVLSQADGVIAMKLTASQDRDAIGAWIEGQADRAKGKEILALLPTMNLGEGVIWIPGRSILKTSTFPENKTFDSSRTPKRGETRRKVDLKPLDLGALKGRLATVEAEAKANDPAALKAQVASLTAQLAKAGKTSTVTLSVTDTKAMERAIAAARLEGAELVRQELPRTLDAQHQASFAQGFAACAAQWRIQVKGLPDKPATIDARQPLPKALMPLAQFMPSKVAAAAPVGKSPGVSPKPPVQPPPPFPGEKLDSVGAPQGRVLAALGFWKAIGRDDPSRAMVAAVSGYSVKSSNFNNVLGGMRTSGLIVIPQPGLVGLADGTPYDAMTPEQAKEKVYSILSAGQRKMVDAMRQFETMTASRPDLAAMSEFSATSSNFNNLIGGLCTLTIFEKPGPGWVGLTSWAKAVLI